MPVGAAKAEARFAAELLGLKRRCVLDVACGYGRHAVHLARNNKVCGLDFSRDYLLEARQKTSGAASANLQVVQGDMRSLPFHSEAFDAVLLLFNSFGYFADAAATSAPAVAAPQMQVWKLPHVFYERELVDKDFGRLSAAGNAPTDDGAQPRPISEDGNRQVLAEMARAAKRGGEFLMELPNPKPLLQLISRQPRRHAVTANYEIEEEYEWNASTHVLHNRTRFSSKGRVEEGEYRIRLYTRQEISALLKSAGLKLVSAFGSYEGEAYKASDSPILLVHACKQ